MIGQTISQLASERGGEQHPSDNPSKNAIDRGTQSTVLCILVNLGLALAKCSAGLCGEFFGGGRLKRKPLADRWIDACS
jgi:hypothetical protein